MPNRTLDRRSVGMISGEGDDGSRSQRIPHVPGFVAFSLTKESLVAHFRQFLGIRLRPLRKLFRVTFAPVGMPKNRVILIIKLSVCLDRNKGIASIYRKTCTILRAKCPIGLHGDQPG